MKLLKKGSLLISPYGTTETSKHILNIIHTGLSFFRELPAGVTGAYKLFEYVILLERY